MTLFTDVVKGRQVSPLDIDSSIPSAMGAAFEQALFENPTSALNRIRTIDESEQGEFVFGQKGLPSYRREPQSPQLTKQEADNRVNESGLDIDVPEQGMREETLNIIIGRKREEKERNLILQSAPKSAIPFVLGSGLAASALDPLNLASGFIPIVGEARYTALVAGASSMIGRVGVRASVGALEGAVGAAALEPLILTASDYDQADYDMTDSLLNVVFGGVLGGGMHSVGGLIGDIRKQRLVDEVEKSLTPEAPEAPAQQEITSPGFIDEQPDIAATMRRQLQENEFAIRERAQRDFIDEEIARLADDIEANGERFPVREIKKENRLADRRLEVLDTKEHFQTVAREFQAEGNSRKKSEQLARQAIAKEREQLNKLKAENQSRIELNRSQEMRRQDKALLEKGIVPDTMQERVKLRMRDKLKGFQEKPLSSQIRLSASQRVNNADFGTQVKALKTALAQSSNGKEINVEDIYSPPKNSDELSRVQNKPVQDGREALSIELSQRLKGVGDDLVEMRKSAADEEEIAKQVMDEYGLDEKSIADDLKELADIEKSTETYSKAYNAVALCSLGR